MKLYVIGDRETVLGFRLVGVNGRVVVDSDSAAAALDEAIAMDHIGVVLITEKVAAEIRDKVNARLYGFGFPLVLEIPDASGPHPDRMKIEDVVRMATGVSI